MKKLHSVSWDRFQIFDSLSVIEVSFINHNIDSNPRHFRLERKQKKDKGYFIVEQNIDYYLLVIIK